MKKALLILINIFFLLKLMPSTVYAIDIPPSDKVRSMVKQYYREFLGWPNPSDSDVTWHVNYINTYGCQADIRNFTGNQIFINRKNSYSTDDFVWMLYRGILSRDPESTWWIDNINNGNYTRDAAVEAFITSPEAGAVCSQGKLKDPHNSFGILTTKREIRQLGVNNQNLGFPPEITPLTLMQTNGQRLYVLPTAWSFLCTSSNNILDSTPNNPLRLLSQNCQLITKPDIYVSFDPNNTASVVRMRYKNPSVVDPITQMTKDWKRTYDGLLSLHLINGQLVGVRHNENVNHEYPASWTGEGMPFSYKNTVQPVPIDTPYIDAAYKYRWPTGCRSGFDIPHYKADGTPVNAPGVYDQCWDSFQNFVSLIQIDTQNGNWSANSSIRNPELDSRVHDQGPIIWPDSNYRGNYDGQGNLAGWRSGGFYQPTSFISENYIYTFFKTVKWGGYCTGSARAPISSNGAAGSWQFFNRNRSTFDIPALPQGFTKEQIRDFYDVSTGQKSDCIVDENDGGASQPQYFNVAKIKGTPYFLAAEERSNTRSGNWIMGIRFSSDLINWSNLWVLSSCNTKSTNGTYVGWGCGQYAYPTFLDKNATTNYEIDPNEFYILGTHATGSLVGYELNAMQLTLAVPTSNFTPTPTSTPPPLPGDLNGDGHVDILDLRQLLANFTNIFDYNILVGNFGK